MSLSLEWRHRVDRWRQELPQHVYRPLGRIEMAGFTTFEQLSPEEAARRTFRPMPAGTPWGAKWEYAWLRGEVVLPQEAAGHRIVARIDPGAESAIFINGILRGAHDRQHPEITLARDATPGTRYEILAEAYAGHGPMVSSAGPTPPWRETVPEPGPTQKVMGECSYGIWEEDAYQLWIDVEALWGLRDSLDPESLRVAEIDRALRDMTVIVDFELPQPEMMATIRAARERLKPVLACFNGSTAPLMFAFGHAHLDVAWLWPLQETERKIGRTVANQLALMEEYPEYRYLQSQAHLFRMLKARYPELYARAQQAVREGQLMPEGGMWVEADTNLAGGEALIRQFVHGKRFFREEFGVESELLWLPDVFGYSGALPQIMRGCGIRYFATAKIFWTYNGGDPFPYNTFTWEGIDGSTVLAHLFTEYSSRTDPRTVIQRWNERVQKDGISTRLLPFGFGDGGGGATRDHLEHVRRLRDLEGAPRVIIASPNDFFRDLQVRGVPEARYVGELYFQAHRGTYTSQARTKRGNRKSELALREAELWGAAAAALAGYAYPYPRMDEAWKLLLLHQFHDILPGSSIHRVYEEAEAAHASVQRQAREVAGEAMARLTGGGEGLTVFNSLSWPRTALVELPEGWAAAADASGQGLPVQGVEGRLWAEVPVPPCGWATIVPSPQGGEGRVRGETLAAQALPPAPSPQGGEGRGEGGVLYERPSAALGARAECATRHGAELPLTLPLSPTGERAQAYLPTRPSPQGGEGRVRGETLDAQTPPSVPSLQGGEGAAAVLENELLRVEFNALGEMTHIFDKETGRDWAAGPCNSFRMYKDVPTSFDAWDIDSQYSLTPLELTERAEFELVSKGPLVARLQVRRRLHQSTMVQEISLRRGSRRVDLATAIDWQERHKLLKVNFPVTIHANEAVHEIQFGHVRRPNHASRPFDADRFEVSNHKWSALVEEGRGFAVLNDCKYGLNVDGNSINLTLLKSALAPDMTADRGRQEFTYAFYAWNGPFAESGVVCEAYDLNCPILTATGAAGERSLFALDAPNVVIEAVKPAEDGSGDVVLRLYEAMRTATHCTLTTTLDVQHAAQTNMLEEVEAPLACERGRIALDFRPFEIKTVRLAIVPSRVSP